MVDPWELQGLYDEVAPYLRMIIYRSPHLEKVKEGVERAEQIISTLGNSYYEAHLRSVLESYIRQYYNMTKMSLSLEDLLLESAYSTTGAQVLEEAIRKFFEKREEVWEAAFRKERERLVETFSRYTEFDTDVRKILLEASKELEQLYGEKADIVFDSSHKDSYTLLSGRGKIIFGYAELDAAFRLSNRKIYPDWFRIFKILAEEYLHLLHYRKIRHLPSLFTNMFGHSEEIWALTESIKIANKLKDLLSDEEAEIFEIFQSTYSIGVAHNVYVRLRDFYLYEGEMEKAKDLIGKFKGVNPERRDWKVFLEERRKELITITIDPTEKLEYDIGRALFLQKRKAPPWWLERGKISSRAMELLGLL